jgi:hypothetical protein
MTEQTGNAVAAVKARQLALVTRHSTAAGGDRVLGEVLASAHAATVEGRSRLDDISREIDTAVQNQAALALDTPAGKREFRKFLLAKQREIGAVITEAHELSISRSAALQGMQSLYIETRPADV